MSTRPPHGAQRIFPPRESDQVITQMWTCHGSLQPWGQGPGPSHGSRARLPPLSTSVLHSSHVEFLSLPPTPHFLSWAAPHPVTLLPSFI